MFCPVSINPFAPLLRQPNDQSLQNMMICLTLHAVVRFHPKVVTANDPDRYKAKNVLRSPFSLSLDHTISVQDLFGLDCLSLSFVISDALLNKSRHLFGKDLKYQIRRIQTRPDHCKPARALLHMCTPIYVYTTPPLSCQNELERNPTPQNPIPTLHLPLQTLSALSGNPKIEAHEGRLI